MSEQEQPDLEESTNEELFEHHRVIADPGQEVVRIDKFLMTRIPNTSRNKIQDAAKNGSILVNSVPVKQNYKVKPGDDVSIVLPFPVRNLELLPEDIPIELDREPVAIKYNNHKFCFISSPICVLHPVPFKCRNQFL